jgi:general secretion pathway protein G
MDQLNSCFMKRTNLLGCVSLALVGLSLSLIQPQRCNAADDAKDTIASAEKNSFKEVTARLDAGGDLYLYLSTEQMLGKLSEKVAQFEQILRSMPHAGEEQRETISRIFGVVTNLITQSGLEDVSGVGMSSIQFEKGLYHNKLFVHHYPGQGQGFLWKLCGTKPHFLGTLDMLPSNTALAMFSDLNLPLLWSVIQKQADESGIPQAEGLMQVLPEKFEEATGLTLDRALGSLGGEFGLVLTLDQSTMIPLPLPSKEPLQIPQPALMLVVKVKDSTIFDRIDEVLEAKMPQGVVKVDQPNLKMRTVAVPLPLPIELRPTIAQSEGYLFLASSDHLVKEALAVRDGQKPGIRSTDEFKHLAKDIPTEGNDFTFCSRRLGQTILDLERKALPVLSHGPNAGAEAIPLLSANYANFGYSVGANTDEGWFCIGNGNQGPGKLLAVAAVVPAAVVAAVALPAMAKAKASAQRTACLANLRKIDNAKKQWAQENNKPDDAAPTMEDLKPYLRGKLACPSGGHYTIGAVDEPARCSIHSRHQNH